MQKGLETGQTRYTCKAVSYTHLDVYKRQAIIGSTGSGKSTVLKLAERFHDVTSGRITVDGIDAVSYTHLAAAGLRARISRR